MAEWLYEEGIGECRAALVERGSILELHIERESAQLRAGAVVTGRLARTLIPKRRGIFRADSGEEVLIEPLPPKAAEGGQLTVEITRERIGEDGRDKLAKGRAAQPGNKPHPGPSLLQRIRATGLPIIPCPAHEEDRLEAHGWSEWIEQAMSGDIGGEEASLRLFLTPAMVLIDVDGSLPPAQLGPKGAKMAARAIRALGLAGSIGVDLPTMNNKTERAIAAEMFDKFLPQPFERTAVNGFGFIQLIRKRERPNIMELVREDETLTAALALLRRAERHQGAGAITLTAHPDVIGRIRAHPEWTALLSRRRGGDVRLQGDDSLAISAGHVH